MEDQLIKKEDKPVVDNPESKKEDFAKKEANILNKLKVMLGLGLEGDMDESKIKARAERLARNKERAAQVKKHLQKIIGIGMLLGGTGLAIASAPVAGTVVGFVGLVAFASDFQKKIEEAEISQTVDNVAGKIETAHNNLMDKEIPFTK